MRVIAASFALVALFVADAANAQTSQTIQLLFTDANGVSVNTAVTGIPAPFCPSSNCPPAVLQTVRYETFFPGGLIFDNTSRVPGPDPTVHVTRTQTTVGFDRTTTFTIVHTPAPGLRPATFIFDRTIRTTQISSQFVSSKIRWSHGRVVATKNLTQSESGAFAALGLK